MAADRTRKSDPIDAYVGGRIRLRRNVLGQSQTTLGDAVGVSFKQIQKYESGTNRIGAGRLYVDRESHTGKPCGHGTCMRIVDFDIVDPTVDGDPVSLHDRVLARAVG